MIVVPYRETDDHRAIALGVVLHHLELWPMVYVSRDEDGDWCKARAVRAALDAHPEAEVVVIHDADVLVQTAHLASAMRAVYDGALWAVPHRLVHRLDRLTTIEFIEAGMLPEHTRLVRPPYVGVAGGGITVVRRDAYDGCPLDPRFVTWGSEDEAWGWALSTFYGPPWRGDADLVHLYHPHAAPGARRSIRMESEKLWRAYRAYRGEPRFMRELIDSIA
jgi:hypothetical protein